MNTIKAAAILAALAGFGLRCPDCQYATTDLLGYADHLAETGHGRGAVPFPEPTREEPR